MLQVIRESKECLGKTFEFINKYARNEPKTPLTPLICIKSQKIHFKREHLSIKKILEYKLKELCINDTEHKADHLKNK